MEVSRNIDTVQRVIRALLRGDDQETIKPLYIEQNTFDVDLDLPIYRIFQLEYLEKDISGNRLTFIHAHPHSWGDDLENPLLKASFPDIETGGRITLDGVVGDFHALSWTKSNIERQESWDEFSRGNPAVRIESTPRLLLDGLMSSEDPWFMLRFYVGLMKYKPRHEIEAWIQGPDFSVHLDSLGQRLACSLMLLQTCFDIEEEVRLLCSPFGNTNCSWAKENLQKKGITLSTPFDWQGRVKSVVYGNMVTPDQQKKFSSLLAQNNISCPESSSCL